MIIDSVLYIWETHQSPPLNAISKKSTYIGQLFIKYDRGKIAHFFLPKMRKSKTLCSKISVHLR